MPITTEIVTITPKQAEEWLSHNTHNRPVRDRHVGALQGVIERGEWEFNGDAIRFASDGSLLDGQHRLLACVFAGKSIKSIVVRGLPKQTQLTMDTLAARRGLADHLRLDGHTNAIALAATINTVWRLREGLIRTTLKPSVHQALNLLDSEKDIVDSLFMSRRWAAKLYGSQAVVAALYHEMSNVDPDAAETFFDGVITGVNLDKTDPRYCLRRRVETGKHSAVMLAALIIKAWNAYVQGREIQELVWRAVGKKAEPFPQIADA